jgi:hypothetical protein
MLVVFLIFYRFLKENYKFNVKIASAGKKATKRKGRETLDELRSSATYSHLSAHKFSDPSRRLKAHLDEPIRQPLCHNANLHYF